MARKTKYQEFLATLSEVTGLTGADFARACGKQRTNMDQYLSGKKRAGKATVVSTLAHLRGSWAVKTVQRVQEVEPIPTPLGKLPTDPGIYALYSSSGDVLYVGQATNLRAEVYQTLNRRVNFVVRRGPTITKKAYPKYKDLADRMSAYVVESPLLRHNLEALLLRVFLNQSHNNKMGSFK
jgi:hypothetical protein